MKIKVSYHWHTDADDVDLGEGWLDVVLPADTLLTIQCPEVSSHVTWCIVQYHVTPAQRGSMGWIAAMERDQQMCIYDVFVEPAEGPFH